jgi:hypothetical protein
MDRRCFLLTSLIPVLARPLSLACAFLIDASLVVVVTSLDATDAREICRTLEVTEDPQCWRRTIRERFPGVLQ